MMLLLEITAETLVQDFVFGFFGADFTLFAFICLMIIAGIVYLYRFPFVLGLILAWVLVYMFDLLGGGNSFILQFLLALLSLGIAVSIVKGVLDYAKEWSN